MPFINVAEPPELFTFRTNNPNATWADLKSTKDVNISVVKNLPKKGAGLCIYCEQKLIPKFDFQVEHFVPKKGDSNSTYSPGEPNWAIHWENLLPACAGGAADINIMPSSVTDPDARLYSSKKNVSCGQIKEDKHPSVGVINPEDLPHTEPIFSYEIDGLMKFNAAAKNLKNLTMTMVEKHIDLLNLNCDRLKRARAKFALALEDEFALAQEIDVNVGELIDSWLIPNNEGLLAQPFFSLILSKYK